MDRDVHSLGDRLGAGKRTMLHGTSFQVRSCHPLSQVRGGMISPGPEGPAGNCQAPLGFLEAECPFEPAAGASPKINKGAEIQVFSRCLLST